MNAKNQKRKKVDSRRNSQKAMKAWDENKKRDACNDQTGM